MHRRRATAVRLIPWLFLGGCGGVTPVEGGWLATIDAVVEDGCGVYAGVDPASSPPSPFTLTLDEDAGTLTLPAGLVCALDEQGAFVCPERTTDEPLDPFDAVVFRTTQLAGTVEARDRIVWDDRFEVRCEGPECDIGVEDAWGELPCASVLRWRATPTDG